MRKLLAALLCFSAPVFAEQPNVKYNTPESLGCIILKECTEEVQKITNVDQLHTVVTDSNFQIIKDEIEQLIKLINDVDVEVFVASGKYFPFGVQGIYHSLHNRMFLNEYYMQKSKFLLGTLRHEGWHVAQDCMAGTLDNSLVAVIMDDKEIPQIYKFLTSKTYASEPKSIPWEQEANWAEGTKSMTINALKACSKGEMWNSYNPTPLTKKYLVEHGYIKS